MKMDFGAAAATGTVFATMPPSSAAIDMSALLSGPAPPADAHTASESSSSYGSPGRMQVLANGDIIDCGRLPQTARNNLYKTELCKHFMETGACRYASKCQFAHGEHELRGVLRHPKYKTTRCKAFVSTGKCMYGNRCRFIHGDNPEDEMDSFSSTGSESDDQETPLKDLMVNPYAHGTESIDLLIPFGGLKQVTLTPLTSIGSSISTSPASPPDIDAFLFRDPFASSEFQLSRENDVSLGGSLSDALSPRTESATAKFSRLSIFQRICREDA
uniref:C3H1-type domain-containing protein n=1 Tax=Globisporangium ultimum (strain ATCC 200006 / CBS 805.95 / DAOM BR144) TaxID=431595 RepID=K3W6M5_GLOUD